jgi:hypothetical protein
MEVQRHSFLPGYYMEVSGQLQGMAALTLLKEAVVSAK